MGDEAGRSKVQSQSLVFAINGRRFELFEVDPSTTLLQFLRSHSFTSVKLGCGEGGCGACVVLLSKYDPVSEQVEHFTVSSCLTLLCSVNRSSITTSDGLGNSKNGFHSIHERFSGFHASQCGFCTPGMCISLFGALVKADKSDRSEPRPGLSKLTVSEAEKSVVGNLCRCTGYRPIADVCKSFAVNVDMEDLGFNSFFRKDDSDLVKLKKLPSYKPSDDSSLFPDFLKEDIRAAVNLTFRKSSWYSPSSLDELQNLLLLSEEIDESSVKLIVGNTGMGYYKDSKCIKSFIDLRFIPELSVIRKDETGIELGATLTLTKVIEVLRQKRDGECNTEGKSVSKQIADHIEKIASGYIRNIGSLGGNLMMAQRRQFPSDLATVLLSVDAMVIILIGGQLEKVTLEEFLGIPPLDTKSVLVSVKIPLCESCTTSTSSTTKTKIHFETYRAAPRPLGNALAYMNAAFLMETATCEDFSESMVTNSFLAFGAFGTKHSIRAKEVEKFLTGKMLSVGVLLEAIKLLKTIIIPEDGTSHSSYRTSLAVSFLFKFLGPLTSGPMVQDVAQFSEKESPTLLSSSKQVVQLNKEYHPVGEPVAKTGATLQASGEAIYVDDMPSPKDCLYGAFIYSTKPLARVKGIKLQPNSPSYGLVSIISFRDIPGENVGSMTIFGQEPLFADEVTQCAGQRIAFVVADTQEHADMAAKAATIDYELKNTEPPILSVEEAVERSSFFEVPSFLNPRQVGDFSKGMAEADQTILNAKIHLGSQYYFYMESQTALAIPDEDNCMLVYSSSQCPEYAHDTIAKCIGIPAHNVRVIARRVGGGFGGKALKAMPIAASCALAAHKLHQPVRTYVDRKTDMIMAGGRHPMKITYSVGFKADGKITALRLDILIDAGMAVDISPMMPRNLIGAVKKYDFGALSFDIKVCKTNLQSRSAMRGPGEVQGSFIAETLIEHVASTLLMDVEIVRKINLHRHESLELFYEHVAGDPLEYTLPSIWGKLAIASSIDHRKEIIKQFNRTNRYRKRGISQVPVVHPVSLRPTPGKVSILRDGSVVVEVGGTELGQGLWTKVKQMAAYALSSVKCDGAQNLLEKVRVIQSDTLSLIQSGFTAGSTTSESSCEAVRICCNVLVERLSSLKERLTEEMGSVKWEVLILQAHLHAVNLQASTLFVPKISSMEYLNYGTAVSEVGINLLTGETTILRSDIIYDCGQSLNPAVDLGQIEGAFVQGIGFFMQEEYPTNADGLVVAEGTWTYKIPTMDTVPKQFNVEILSSGHHKDRVLSSKASGEPPLLLAVSVHCATRAAISEARLQYNECSTTNKLSRIFELKVPAIMPEVKELCGLDMVETYLQFIMQRPKESSAV